MGVTLQSQRMSGAEERSPVSSSRHACLLMRDQTLYSLPRSMAELSSGLATLQPAHLICASNTLVT